MIVLDEQLLGRNLEYVIAQWWRGRFCFITDLRPHTIIKDETIPHLLHQANYPTFITINERDFWLKTPANKHYCVICFSLSDPEATQISSLLRHLFSLPELKTKADRMGKVIRMTREAIFYYSTEQRQPQLISK